MAHSRVVPLSVIGFGHPNVMAHLDRAIRSNTVLRRAMTTGAIVGAEKNQGPIVPAAPHMTTAGAAPNQSPVVSTNLHQSNNVASRCFMQSAIYSASA